MIISFSFEKQKNTWQWWPRRLSFRFFEVDDCQRKQTKINLLSYYPNEYDSRENCSLMNLAEEMQIEWSKFCHTISVKLYEPMGIDFLDFIFSPKGIIYSGFIMSCIPQRCHISFIITQILSTSSLIKKHSSLIFANFLGKPIRIYIYISVWKGQCLVLSNFRIKQ